MKCPECQSDNKETAKFCNECGCDLRRTDEVPSKDYANPQAYTPRFLADQILKSKSTVEGERKLVTVLFADVADYTAMAEKLDPEGVHQIMDGCFKILMEEIHRYEGTINQFTYRFKYFSLVRLAGNEYYTQEVTVSSSFHLVPRNAQIYREGPHGGSDTSHIICTTLTRDCHVGLTAVGSPRSLPVGTVDVCVLHAMRRVGMQFNIYQKGDNES
jgi:hypothetical protein